MQSMQEFEERQIAKVIRMRLEEKIRVSTNLKYSNLEVQLMRSAAAAETGHNLAASLEAAFLAMEVETQEKYIPVTWIDHFKMAHRDKWWYRLLFRFATEPSYHRVPIKRIHICPHHQIDKAQEHLEFLVRTDFLNEMAERCHTNSVNAGWWDGLSTKNPYTLGTKLALVHSEISEALEGMRKNLRDDHLPHRNMFEVELADALIRIFDLAGSQCMDLHGAVMEKIQYNTNRADHKRENRAKEGGKKI